MEICLITNLENRWGLSKDVKILEAALKEHGHNTYVAQWNRTAIQGKKFHLNIHIELVGGRHFTMGRRNILIPNQEWFLPEWTRRKARFQKTLCKTTLGAGIYTRLGFQNVTMTGFTSEDRYRTGFKRVREFYHLAGNSLFKNTEAIINAWVQNPRWPTLHVYGSNPALQNFVKPADNIDYNFGRHLADDVILEIQNTFWFAVQPSASEGYGHCITEPLSTGGLVVGIDAPPMNEFPAIHRMPAKQYATHHYGQLFVPTTVDITDLLNLSDAELVTQGETMRHWWVENRRNFIKNLGSAIL